MQPWKNMQTKATSLSVACSGNYIPVEITISCAACPKMERKLSIQLNLTGFGFTLFPLYLNSQPCLTYRKRWWQRERDGGGRDRGSEREGEMLNSVKTDWNDCYHTSRIVGRVTITTIDRHSASDIRSALTVRE